jgi:predicted acetyltransferase
MEGPRPPLENEFPSVVKFLDSQLRSKEGWSITTEYPVAISEANRNNIRIITESDEVLAHAVIRPMIIKAPAGLFKVAGLGSVVTSSEHRNLGLSSKTIESCLEAARTHGCDFAILWTNIYDFYRKFGFELAGSELSCLLDRDLDLSSYISSRDTSHDSSHDSSNDGELKFIDGNKVAPEAIHRLYSQHTVTSLRTVDETRKYLQIPNSRVYTAWNSRGVLKAYAIEGKGADLNSYVHEWGGSVSALLPLFSHIRKAQERNITVIIPQHSQNLRRAFEAQRIAINRGYLGMIKILNPQNLFAKIKRHTRHLGIQDFVLDTEMVPDANGVLSRKFLIGSRNQVFTTDSEHDIVRLLFGPAKASQIHNFGANAKVIEKALPINMWVWGWDSI